MKGPALRSATRPAATKTPPTASPDESQHSTQHTNSNSTHTHTNPTQTHRHQHANNNKQALLDVAHALQYLHRIGLLHGDVKLDNVLLKSEAARAAGFVPKLADFGLTRILGESDAGVVNHSGAG